MHYKYRLKQQNNKIYNLERKKMPFYDIFEP